MRNLKKFLALVLAMMMVFSLMVTVNAATDFADADEVSPAYAEAVEVLAGIGVIEGGSSDKLTPKDTFTRAHLATVAYRVGTGSTADTTEVELFRGRGPFTDVPETNWANPYINFAYNAEWVHGVNEAQTLYNPGGTVTGYQALALLLQILGYGKQDEFLGREWQIEAARYGKEAGLTNGLVNTTLSSAATREQVFQMMFNALQANPVTYSADAKGYKADEETLGEKYFDLVCVNDVEDWGRPVRVWFKDTDGDGQKDANEKTYVTITATPVAEFHVAMSDCDIIDEFGLEEGSIVDYYLNGNQTATALASYPEFDSIIEELDVTDYIGGQGCITEIYEVDAGYHIVQINTYLAKVTKVTAAYTDPKGHTTDREITLEIYADSINGDAYQTIATVKSNVYAKGDHVLVQINKPVDGGGDGLFTAANDTYSKVVLVGTAPVIGSGKLTTWTTGNGDTPATSTVGGKKLNENVSFIRNYHDTSTSWIAYGDQFDDVNLIGLDVGTENYVIVEALAWIHDGTVKGGYAAADLLTTEGVSIPGVPVAEIGTTDVQPVVNDNTGPVGDSGKVADNWKNNTGYYGHLYNYSVNENNEYILSKHATPAANIVDVAAGKGTITQKSPTILDNVNPAAVATDYTLFLVDDDNDWVFEQYTGKDNVPSLINAELCILNNDEGYAVLVIARGTRAGTSSSLIAYVGQAVGAAGKNASGHYGYWVYPIGETEPVMVYDTNGSWASMKTGLYSFAVNGKNEFSAAPTLLAVDSEQGNALVNTGYTTGSNVWYRTLVSGASTSGTSIFADTWDSGTIASAQYNVYKLAFNTNREALKVIEVSKASDAANVNAVRLREIEVTDIEKDDVVIVVSDDLSSGRYANYIYVIKVAVTGGGAGVSPSNKTKTGITSISFASAKFTITFDDDGLTGFLGTETPVKVTITDPEGIIVSNATGTLAATVNPGEYTVEVAYTGTIGSSTVTSGTLKMGDFTVTWSGYKVV